MNVLVVKGNNRPAEEAISSKMYETFLAAAKENEKLNITTYNLDSRRHLTRNKCKTRQIKVWTVF